MPQHRQGPEREGSSASSLLVHITAVIIRMQLSLFNHLFVAQGKTNTKLSWIPSLVWSFVLVCNGPWATLYLGNGPNVFFQDWVQQQIAPITMALLAMWAWNGFVKCQAQENSSWPCLLFSLNMGTIRLLWLNCCSRWV